MTDDEMRIAIAEACGWTKIKDDLIAPGVRDLRGQHPTWMVKSAPIPDYLNDLNAMHEAEKILTLTQQDIYGRHLAVYRNDDSISHFRAAHAPANVRAKLFIQILNLQSK